MKFIRVKPDDTAPAKVREKAFKINDNLSPECEQMLSRLIDKGAALEVDERTARFYANAGSCAAYAVYDDNGVFLNYIYCGAGGGG